MASLLEQRYVALLRTDCANLLAYLRLNEGPEWPAGGEIDIVEVDDAGLIKVNPLANWSFKQVQAYIQENQVPTNDLLDQGYRSVGDWHSTQPVTDSEDERAGRWKGRQKTECGIHNKPSKYAMYLLEMERKQREEEQRLKSEERLNEAVQATAITV